MALYAIVKSPLNTTLDNMGLFYTKDDKEALEFARLGFKKVESVCEQGFRQNMQWLWEVYELPEDFKKPSIKDIENRFESRYYQSVVPKFVERVRQNAIRKLMKEI